MDAVANRPEQQKDRKRFWRDYLPIEKIGFGNLVFVIFYTVLTLVLALTAYRQYKGLRTDERPWVRVWIDEPTAPQQTLDIPTHILNSGKTPARSTRVQFSVEVVRNGQEPQMTEPPVVRASTGALFPNVPAGQPIEYPFSQSDLEDFKQGRAFVVVYGQATYSDFFHVGHWTKFCTFFGAITGGYTAKKCTDYNDIDEN